MFCVLLMCTASRTEQPGLASWQICDLLPKPMLEETFGGTFAEPTAAAPDFGPSCRIFQMPPQWRTIRVVVSTVPRRPTVGRRPAAWRRCREF